MKEGKCYGVSGTFELEKGFIPDLISKSNEYDHIVWNKAHEPTKADLLPIFVQQSGWPHIQIVSVKINDVQELKRCKYCGDWVSWGYDNCPDAGRDCMMMDSYTQTQKWLGELRDYSNRLKAVDNG